MNEIERAVNRGLKDADSIRAGGAEGDEVIEFAIMGALLSYMTSMNVSEYQHKLWRKFRKR